MSLFNTGFLMLSRQALFTALVASLALTQSAWVSALPTDRQQAIHIQSNSAERDEKKGITTYSGTVQMDQGSMRILADKVVIHSVDNKANKIVATGNPAHYQQQPSADKGLVVAKGQTVIYLIANEKLQLIKQASLVQEGTTMTGERIDYDIKKSLMKANSDAQQTQRIHIVIPPQNAVSPTDSTEEK